MREMANLLKNRRSVSEMKEWTCSKVDRPDGEVIRDCMRLYTGGTLFRVCYTNSADGSTCLCSSELCNGAAAAARPLALLGPALGVVVAARTLSGTALR